MVGYGGICRRRLTVRDTLVIIIRLRRLEVNTNILIINLILNIRQQNKRRHHPLPPSRLKPRLHIPIPHIPRRRQHRAHRTRRHRQQQRILIRHRVPIHHPVRLGRVTKVLRFRRDPRHILECVCLVLAHRRRHARVEPEGGEGVAAAEAVGALTAVAVFCGLSAGRSWLGYSW